MPKRQALSPGTKQCGYKCGEITLSHCPRFLLSVDIVLNIVPPSALAATLILLEDIGLGLSSVQNAISVKSPPASAVRLVQLLSESPRDSARPAYDMRLVARQRHSVDGAHGKFNRTGGDVC